MEEAALVRKTKRDEDPARAAAAGGQKRRAALSSLTNQKCVVVEPCLPKIPAALLPAPSCAELKQDGMYPSTVGPVTDAAGALPLAPQPQLPGLCLPPFPSPSLPSPPSPAPEEEDRHRVMIYSQDIRAYQGEVELRLRPKVTYMRKQRDISYGMRAILVDWLVEVAEEYRLHTHTLYVAVSYIDRFLSEMSVQRGKLQLVGVTCMLLAAKFEEIYPPAIDEFVYITDNTYTRDQIIKMEHLVLKVLRFDMGSATALTFVEPVLQALRASDQLRFLTMYYAELTLQDAERFLKHLPSVVAAACLAMALHTLGLPAWPQALREAAPGPDHVLCCLVDLHSALLAAPADPQQAIREKYSRVRFLRASAMPVPHSIPDIYSPEHQVF